LENIDTKEMYKSKSLSSLSPHSVIQNLAPGKYFIRKTEVPVGNLMYSNWSASEEKIENKNTGWKSGEL
jgi:hypothetical protein